MRITISIEKSTRLTQQEVLDRAVLYFGPDGWGLDLVERGDCCARFRGLGGALVIETSHSGERGSKVHLQGKETEHGIREFLQTLPD